jgi:predicted acyl esterase
VPEDEGTIAIEWDVPIAMNDGIVLRADVFRPTGDGPFPVLLSHGPYAKGLPFQQGYPVQWRLMIESHPEVAAGSTNAYQRWELVDPEKWVPHGYACVRVDSRGAGRSPGVIDCWSPRETRDMAACIEWAGTREWSNGKVGLAGISYYATNQWQVAGLQPEHLAAICPWEGFADFYRDLAYHGGIRSSFVANWYPHQVSTVQHGLGVNGPTNADTGELVTGPETLSVEELDRSKVDLLKSLGEHPLDDDYYRDRSADWSKVTVPLLTCANWGGQGLHLRGNVEGFVRAASEQKWLECHGLEHWTHFYTDYGRDLQRRFFDHFLKGEDNGWDREPPVRLQIRHPGERFVERTEQEWPIARTRWTRFYLDADAGSLATDVPTEDHAVAYPGTGDGVTFRTPPLPEEVELTGPLSSKLFVSSSADDLDVFVVVRVFDLDGNEVAFQGALEPRSPVAQGWLRASHRRLDPELTLEYRPYHVHREREPLTPGQVYELDVEIWPTCIVIPAGHRIALTVRGTDHDHGAEPVQMGWFVMSGSGPFRHDDAADRPAALVETEATVHTGRSHPSSVLLPVVPPRD